MRRSRRQRRPRWTWVRGLEAPPSGCAAGCGHNLPRGGSRAPRDASAEGPSRGLSYWSWPAPCPENHDAEGRGTPRAARGSSPSAPSSSTSAGAGGAGSTGACADGRRKQPSWPSGKNRMHTPVCSHKLRTTVLFLQFHIQVKCSNIRI